MPNHDYTTRILWTGNRGEGTAHYKAYDRTWDIAVPGKAVVHCSNDPLLGGDPAKMNPEDLLLSALSSCHMLWYLHYASDAGIVVTSSEKSQHVNRDKAMKNLRVRLYDMQRQMKDDARSDSRKSQVGSGDRSERIRTYNFPQGRVTDHRIGLTLHSLPQILEGDIDPLLNALIAEDQAARLADLEAEFG